MNVYLHAGRPRRTALSIAVTALVAVAWVLDRAVPRAVAWMDEVLP